MSQRTGSTRSARSEVELDRTEQILLDAEGVFARYGFRRTSMSEVAREAGLSRAGLYKHFATKESLFRAVVASLHEGTLRAVETVATEAGLPLEERITGMLDARMGFFLDRHRGSVHAEELYTESNRICGDVVAETSTRFRKRLARVLREADAAGELDLGGAGLTARAAADLGAATATGLKGSPSELRSRSVFRRDLARWVGIFVRGLRPGA